MSPESITIEKDGIVIANVGRYEATELAEGRFELVISDITGCDPDRKVDPTDNVDNFDLVAIIGKVLVIYGPCRWIKIGETGTLGNMELVSLTAVAEHRIEMNRPEPEVPVHTGENGGSQERWNGSELDLTLTAG